MMKCKAEIDREVHTNAVAHLVRNKFLGSLLESLGIQRHMRHFNSSIPSAISAFSDELAFLRSRAAKTDYYADCDRESFL